MTATSPQVQLALRYLLTNLNNLHNKFISPSDNDARLINPMTSYDVAMACYGLQCMSSSQSSVVRGLVFALANLTEGVSDHMSNSQFALSMYGLKVGFITSINA
jgi:hypothetical protein